MRPIVWAFVIVGSVCVSIAQAEITPKVEKGVAWYDVSQWGIEGRGWPIADMDRFYDRLPRKAETTVRGAVWNLSRHSAGLSTRFHTDATTIRVRYRLTSSRVSMPHMPATGVSGVDLYAQDEKDTWRWVAVSRPGGQDVNATLANGLKPGARDYMLYLPLYNGVQKLEIGVPAGARFQPVAPRRQKPIVFYGTSITHGACASRPGMPHPAILSRRLGRPVINLGFSGNGKMDKEVGDLLVEIDAAVYVIDCLPNMNGALVSQRAEPLVKQLRAAHPNTPIVLVEDRENTNAWLLPARKQHHVANRAALRSAYESLTKAGVKRLYYIGYENLLGQDNDGATDGSHPSDLGFARQADAFEPVLRKALSQDVVKTP